MNFQCVWVINVLNVGPIVNKEGKVKAWMSKARAEKYAQKHKLGVAEADYIIQFV